MTERSRTFGPVTAVGLAAAVLAAVGSSRVRWSVRDRDVGSTLTLLFDEGQLPLATTLSMVVLAAWGVVLVTRGRWRVAVAVTGAAASLGVLATVVAGWWLVPDSLREALEEIGSPETEIDPSAWYWPTLAAALVSAVAAVLAVWWVRSWPEIGTRYDTPTGEGAVPAEPDEATSLDLWKAQDKGRDPTA